MQEINDLKNIVIQSLESKGILSQLRAQIRSSVFKIIEDQESKDSKNPAFFWENPLCQKIHESEEGLIAIELMHEFFEFFRMDYTNNVFIHESNYKESFTRDECKKKLKIDDIKNEQPLLMLLIKTLLSGVMIGGRDAERGSQKNQDNNSRKEIEADKGNMSKSPKKEENPTVAIASEVIEGGSDITEAKNNREERVDRDRETKVNLEKERESINPLSNKSNLSSKIDETENMPKPTASNEGPNIKAAKEPQSIPSKDTRDRDDKQKQNEATPSSDQFDPKISTN